MQRRLVAAIFALMCCFAGATLADARSHHATAPVAAQGSITMFGDEGAAQRHCPADQVVWLNLPTGIYHEKGMRWYGRTKSGAYVCRREADAVGYRDTRNGQ